MLSINWLFTRAKCGGGISRSEVNGPFYQGDLLGVCVVGVYIEFSTVHLRIAIGQVYNEWHIWFFGNFQVSFSLNAYFTSLHGKFTGNPSVVTAFSRICVLSEIGRGSRRER